MKKFLRNISPRRAVTDFAKVWREPTDHRWPVLGVAMALTFALFMLFIPADRRIDPRPPEVIYISTWSDGRTEREIIASNCQNQRLKDDLEDRMAQRAEIRRDMYMALGRATFIDVDAIEAEAEAEAARVAAANEAATTGLESAMTVEEYCARALG